MRHSGAPDDSEPPPSDWPRVKSTYLASGDNPPP